MVPYLVVFFLTVKALVFAQLVGDSVARKELEQAFYNYSCFLRNLHLERHFWIQNRVGSELADFGRLQKLVKSFSIEGKDAMQQFEKADPHRKPIVCLRSESVQPELG